MKKISKTVMKLAAFLLALVLVIGTVPAAVYAAENDAAVTGITLNKDAVVMEVGEVVTLVATVAPANAANKEITWTTNNASVAVVDSTGKVTARALGEATIKAASDDGRVYATCKVSVVTDVIEVTGVQLDLADMALTAGKTRALTATVQPANASNPGVLWTSSNTAVATVDKAGNVTGVAEGYSFITATTEDGGFTAQCMVTVSAAVVDVTGVTLDKTELQLVIGDSDLLTATVAPANATNQKINWVSTDESIATVSGMGKVTAVALGTTSIVAITEDGGLSAICTVTVVNAPVAVAGISLNKTATELYVGEAESLLAVFAPEDATNKNVVWTSNDTDVVTVDAAGKITAIGVGVAVVTVTTEEGKFAASCAVTVKNRPVTAVELNKDATKMIVGDSILLTAKVYPDNATIKDVIWSSSDETVAIVDQDGKVSALKAGKAVITITSVDSGVTASCEVTVENISVTGIKLDITAARITAGDVLELKATITPSNATIKSLVWTSSDESVAVVDKNGKVTALKHGVAVITVTTVDGGLTATCTLNVKKALIDNPFSDVKATDYFYTPVRWAVTEDITAGTSATTFSPNMSCTRAQVVTFLWRAAGSPEPKSTENPFSDVNENAYFYKAILWAVETGITSGTSEKKFSPNMACNRAQVATFLWRANGAEKPVTTENPFADVKETDYFYEAVLWAVENGITTGMGDKKFSPNTACNRGQIVTFLYRASEAADQY